MPTPGDDANQSFCILCACMGSVLVGQGVAANCPCTTVGIGCCLCAVFPFCVGCSSK